jgi:hypothetical protein
VGRNKPLKQVYISFSPYRSKINANIIPIPELCPVFRIIL